MPEHADYAEILRLHRKYREQEGEPLWKVFVRVGQRLEKAKPDRCKTCHRTALEYSRLIDVTCDDPWHANKADPRGPFFLTQWEREDYERRQHGEPELGPGGVSHS